MLRSGVDGGLVRRLVFAMVLLAMPLRPASAAPAVDEVDKGPEVGTDVARLVSATDQQGVPRTFRTLTGKRGLILLFSRSLDW